MGSTCHSDLIAFLQSTHMDSTIVLFRDHSFQRIVVSKAMNKEPTWNKKKLPVTFKQKKKYNNEEHVQSKKDTR